MPRKTTTKTKLAESKIIEKQEWLEFKVEAQQDVPPKHWWASSTKETTTCFVNVRAKDIVAVCQYPNDRFNKTFLSMVNSQHFVVLMPYEKVMEIV